MVSHASAFSSLFPGAVGVHAVALTQELFPLYAEEQGAVSRSVPKRVREFAAGRYCARQAMQRCCLSPCAIPSQADRTPLWPRGVVGSITHCATVAAAVVASSSDYRGLGIDIEPVGAVAHDLADLFLHPEERHQDIMRGQDASWLTVYFCIKEAAYKALYPPFKMVLDFQEMLIVLDRNLRSFVVNVPPRFPDKNFAISGRFTIHRDHVHAAAWIARSDNPLDHHNSL